MESIIEKLEETDNDFSSWTLQEKKQLLEFYYRISNNEYKIFDLIYRYHECDSWEDIFRDYDIRLLTDKTRGVKIAIDVIDERICESKE